MTSFQKCYSIVYFIYVVVAIYNFFFNKEVGRLSFEDINKEELIPEACDCSDLFVHQRRWSTFGLLPGHTSRRKTATFLAPGRPPPAGGLAVEIQTKCGGNQCLGFHATRMSLMTWRGRIHGASPYLNFMLINLLPKLRADQSFGDPILKCQFSRYSHCKKSPRIALTKR